jgi:hypothetical protein
MSPFLNCINFQTPISTNITKLTGEFKLNTLKKVTKQALIITKSIYQIFNKLYHMLPYKDSLFT